MFSVVAHVALRVPPVSESTLVPISAFSASTDIVYRVEVCSSVWAGSLVQEKTVSMETAAIALSKSEVVMAISDYSQVSELAAP